MRWQNAKRRPPRRAGRYIVFHTGYDDYPEHIAFAYYAPERKDLTGNGWYGFEEYRTVAYNDITHWMKQPGIPLLETFKQLSSHHA